MKISFPFQSPILKALKLNNPGPVKRASHVSLRCCRSVPHSQANNNKHQIFCHIQQKAIEDHFRGLSKHIKTFPNFQRTEKPQGTGKDRPVARSWQPPRVFNCPFWELITLSFLGLLCNRYPRPGSRAEFIVCCSSSFGFLSGHHENYFIKISCALSQWDQVQYRSKPSGSIFKFVTERALLGQPRWCVLECVNNSSLDAAFRDLRETLTTIHGADRHHTSRRQSLSVRAFPNWASDDGLRVKMF